MAYWLIQIKCKDQDLSLLEENLKTRNISIVREKNKTYLKIENLIQKAGVDEFGKVALRIIDVVNGTAKAAFYKQFLGIAFGGFVKYTDDEGNEQSRNITLLSEEKMPKTMYYGNWSPPPLLDWIVLALQNDTVEKAMTLYGTLEHNWRELYIIFETIEGDVGDEDDLIAKKWVSKKKIKLFKRTANSYRAIGKDARHAKVKDIPPTVPMKLSEAQYVVYEILMAWLASKE